MAAVWNVAERKTTIQNDTNDNLFSHIMSEEDRTLWTPAKLLNNQQGHVRRQVQTCWIVYWKVSARRRGGGKCLSVCLSSADEYCCSYNRYRKPQNECCRRIEGRETSCHFCIYHLWRATDILKLDDEQSFLNKLKSFKIIHNSGKIWSFKKNHTFKNNWLHPV